MSPANKDTSAKSRSPIIYSTVVAFGIGGQRRGWRSDSSVKICIKDLQCDAPITHAFLITRLSSLKRIPKVEIRRCTSNETPSPFAHPRPNLL